ncbi:hypothetical protein BDV12DRAFT_193521 [Aspergillus spectabilis]
MNTFHLLTFLLSCLYAASIQAQQTTTGTVTPPPVPEPSTLAILRPSGGETITVGEPYTISWSDPPPPEGPLAIELFGRVNSIYRLLPETTSCDGWLINTECDKLNVSIPSGSTSYVWNLTAPYGFTGFVQDELSFHLGLYVDDLECGVLPETAAPWYWSAEFVLTYTSTTTKITTTKTTIATISSSSSSTTTASGIIPETSDPEETDRPRSTVDGNDSGPTDGAMSLVRGGLGLWNMAGLMAMWAVAAILLV